MGKVRRLAVNDVVFRNLPYSQVANKHGVTKSAVCKWVKRASDDHREFIHTISSRPHHHPNELPPHIVDNIIEVRNKYKRCAPVIYAHLKNEGVEVSLSSVGRVLQREHLVRSKRPAKWPNKIRRPVSTAPGVLVQADTIHIVKHQYDKFFIYAVIDTFTRFGYAEYQPRINQSASVRAVIHANKYFGFPFHVVQTDNGPEFKTGFELHLRKNNIKVRHSRVRKPNDNAHVERFIRTIQEECFRDSYPKERTAQRRLTEYIKYYNYERLHMSLNMQTPASFVSKLLS